MSKLMALVLDGPCAGSYDVRRVTERMVFTRDRRTGQQFALDEDGDTIEPTEDAFIYAVTGGIGWICGRGPGMPARTVSLEYAGTLNPGTGEFLAAAPEDLERIHREGRKRLVAMAFPKKDDTARTTAAPAETEPQGALF